MRVQLRKNIKTDDGETLPKATEGVSIGVSWGDKFDGDIYHVQIKEKRYQINRTDLDFYAQDS